MPRRVSHPTDVPVFAGVAQRVLRLGDPAAECASSGERAVTGTDLSAACQMESSIKLELQLLPDIVQGHSFLAKIN